MLKNTHTVQDSIGLTNPTTSIQENDTAYVIYTSGSTGKPKGVMISHKALLSRTLGLVDRYQLSEQDRVLQFAAFSFDVAAEEIFPTWLTGGCVVVAPKECTQSVPKLMQLVDNENINVLNLPAPYWHEWVTQLRMTGIPDSVRLVITGSDKVLKTHMETWKQYSNKTVPVYCGYGPTEATITATLHTEQDTQSGMSDCMFIGKPLPDTEIYILDKQTQVVPIGVLGELYIAGAGLAIGYLHRPDLTAENFITHTLDESGNLTRLYKTGDLARYLPDGNIEFLGRIDEQVKIRGFRIELGGIEAVLNQHPSVDTSVVLAQDNPAGQSYLAAYILVKSKQSNQTLDNELRQELRNYIADQVPNYMIPSTFIILDELPLTPSGKIDIKALPEPQNHSDTDYISPQTETEILLATIWKEMLEIPEVGLFDQFFELGGHSLLVARLLHRVNEAFNVDLPIASLFTHSRLDTFAAHIDQAHLGLAEIRQSFDFQAEVHLDEHITPINNDFRVEIDTLEAIFITGATGFIGAYLLHQLLQQTSAQIYCLIRANSLMEGMQRIQDSLSKYNLWHKKFEERLVCLLGDLALEKFGLSDETFDQLAQTIDVIYHNGAWVNHVYPYSVLKAANVGGTQEALRLACHIRTKPLHYISSISVFNANVTEIYENAHLDGAEHLGNGYAETKWVADKLVSLANERGLPTTIYRIGGVSGLAESGFTHVNDNFFRTVQTAVQLGFALDGPFGNDNLVPVDYTTRAIVYLSTQRYLQGTVFHIDNPQTVSASLTEALLKMGHDIQLLPAKQWLDKLVQKAQNSPNIGLHPLLPMLREYDLETPLSAVVFDYKNTTTGLQDSGIQCPTIDVNRLVEYFTWLTEQGHLPSQIRQM